MIEVYVDGSCKGNPGPMRIAMMIENYGYTTKNIGNGTNNIAEYKALIAALQFIIDNPILLTEPIIIKSDSRLVVEQMNGNWKVNDLKLISLVQAADKLMKVLFNIKIQWIPREENLAGKLLE